MPELPPFETVAFARTRVNLSLHHLLAACRHASRLSELERANAHTPFGEFWEEILQNALGVVTLGTAALEAYANELYFEGAAIGSVLGSAASEECISIADNLPILRKFSLVLALRSKRRLDLGARPVQNVSDLIQLRNAVVHFRPEWWSDAHGRHVRLSKRVEHRFSASPFLPGEHLFPRAWASRSFAEWTIRSIVSYLDYFHREAALQNPINQFRERIASLSGCSFDTR